ncbi:hypothetical protein E5N72_00020 [Pseudoalteromonas sp. MEBiC 03607]|jgi:hypothetical protein|uniref:hypothetical protein n=1 Tax=unclassified Pseudoalteromonas TaxID=194690 RepID=UPI001094130E|nr:MULTISPECIES: hypothetical protein [unclassified Pseudoalteromonas]TGV18549.1 hypothetical protein E5N72_00020 [Pseudoalteromonas sp. MEBiC 03607]
MIKNKVGIFWYVENTLIYKAINTANLEVDTLGLIDSPFLHHEEWEENLIFEQFDIYLSESDYYNFPRGRVIYNFNELVTYIYLDRKLFKKHIVKKIKHAFSLFEVKTIFLTDPHYKCFKNI